jgi:hypothetical protein
MMTSFLTYGVRIRSTTREFALFGRNEEGDIRKKLRPWKGRSGTVFADNLCFSSFLVVALYLETFQHI